MCIWARDEFKCGCISDKWPLLPRCDNAATHRYEDDKGPYCPPPADEAMLQICKAHHCCCVHCCQVDILKSLIRYEPNSTHKHIMGYAYEVLTNSYWHESEADDRARQHHARCAHRRSDYDELYPGRLMMMESTARQRNPIPRPVDGPGAVPAPVAAQAYAAGGLHRSMSSTADGQDLTRGRPALGNPSAGEDDVVDRGTMRQIISSLQPPRKRSGSREPDVGRRGGRRNRGRSG